MRLLLSSRWEAWSPGLDVPVPHRVTIPGGGPRPQWLRDERVARRGLLGGRGVLAVPECGEQAGCGREEGGQCLSYSQGLGC